MSEQYEEVSRFLYQEASALDNRCFDDWLDLLDEKIVYRMPVRVTRDASDRTSDFVEKMAYFEENKQSLKIRVDRLKTTSAWAENPPSRTRHFVTNIMIESGSTPDEVRVNSCLLLMRNRNDNPNSDLIFADRQDVLKREGDTWKIRHRIIYLDQSVLGSLNLGIFL